MIKNLSLALLCATLAGFGALVLWGALAGVIGFVLGAIAYLGVDTFDNERRVKL